MHVPSKPAMTLRPGELLIEGDGDVPQLVLAVQYQPSRDLVTVRTSERERQFRLDERVCALPSDR